MSAELRHRCVHTDKVPHRRGTYGYIGGEGAPSPSYFIGGEGAPSPSYFVGGEGAPSPS